MSDPSTSGNATPNSSQDNSSIFGSDINWGGLAYFNKTSDAQDIQDVPDVATDAPDKPKSKNYRSKNVPAPDEKDKWVNGGWSKMSHWYVNYPDQIDEIMFVGAKEDAEYYKKNPDSISDLVRDRLEQEETRTNEIMSNSSDPIDEKTARDQAKQALNQEYQEKLELEAKERRDLEAKERAAMEAEEKKRLEDERHADEGKQLERLNIGLQNAKADLDACKASLVESYAKSRRLIVGKNNRAKFIEDQTRYRESLNKYLRIQTQIEDRTKQILCGRSMESEANALNEKIKAGEITADEANQALVDKWDEFQKERKTAVSAYFVKEYLNEQKDLENKTIYQIDNGNRYRKVVSKIINNKALRATLALAGIAGLATTGFGLAAGTLTVAFNPITVGGFAFGASKGAISAAIMSRQDSRNSAVRNFMGSKKEIRKQLEGIDPENDENVKNVTDWLLEQYSKASQADHASNVKRTAIAVGLGAAIGGFMSGVQIKSKTPDTNTGTSNTSNAGGRETANSYSGQEVPSEVGSAKINEISHAKGTGTQQLFREVGGDGDTYYSSGAHDIMAEVVKRYGMTVGENDFTYPGPISEWPDTARAAFTEVANEWAKQGLLGNNTIPINPPINNPITDIADEVVGNALSQQFVNAPNKLANRIIDATTVVGTGLLGGAIASRNNHITSPESLQLVDSTSDTEPIPDQYLFASLSQGGQPARPQQPTRPQNGSAQQPQPTSGQPQPNQQPNQQPNNSANGPIISRETPGDLINRLGLVAEPNSLLYMTSEGLLDGKDRIKEGAISNKVSKWWNSLDENTRNEIIKYEQANADVLKNTVLYNWLNRIQHWFQQGPVAS